MTRAQLLTAAVLIACGCSGASVGPVSPIQAAPPSDSLDITGTVSTDASVSPTGVSMLLASGDMVDLVGTEAQRLTGLGGAEVQLRGTWTTPVEPRLDSELGLLAVRPAFAVDRFVVLAVGGREALDGMLEEDEGKYYLQLSRGDVHWFDDVPPEFSSFLGKRVWVTGSMGDPPLTFGVIY